MSLIKSFLKLKFLINLIIFSGILLISWSFISELFFHYVARFTPELIDENIFWRAEYSEIVNSLFLLIFGIILTTMGFLMKIKFKKSKYPKRKK